MKTFNCKPFFRAFLLTSIIAATGCAPRTYISPSGDKLVLQKSAENQNGGIDPAVAARCMDGETEIYSKLFGDKYNPCVELGIFLINNNLQEEGIPLIQKGMAVANAYNSKESVLLTSTLGIMQKTQLANLLFDICLGRKIQDLNDGKDITAEICGKAGELFENIKYRENALLMYRKKCELSGNCDELRRLEKKTR